VCIATSTVLYFYDTTLLETTPPGHLPQFPVEKKILNGGNDRQTLVFPKNSADARIQSAVHAKTKAAQGQSGASIRCDDVPSECEPVDTTTTL
jgi:hypothetical protein